MSNKCHAACKSFAQTIRNVVVGTALGVFATFNNGDSFDEHQTTDTQSGATYVRNLEPEDNKQPALRPEKPCAPSPVTKVTPQGTITTMEVPPDCPGKYLDTQKS